MSDSETKTDEQAAREWCLACAINGRRDHVSANFGARSASVNAFLAGCEFKGKQLQSEIAAKDARIAELERHLEEEIESRDGWQERAYDLACETGEVGEFTNINDPIERAKENIARAEEKLEKAIAERDAERAVVDFYADTRNSDWDAGRGARARQKQRGEE